MEAVWSESKAPDSSTIKLGNGQVAVGIDLGTSNSCVSIWLEDQGRAKTIKCKKTALRTIPSVVWLDENGVIKAVGQDALDAWESAKSTTAPGTLLRGCKRFVGRRYADVDPKEVAALPYTVTHSSTDKDQILIGPVKSKDSSSRWMSSGPITVSPEEVAAAILEYLCGIAQDYVAKGNAKVSHAVITVPAFFNERQRAATKRAGELAGLKVLRILSEPMAAAMSYGLFVAGSKVVLVVDMGGGTLDVSLLRISNGKFEAIAIRGDNHLGGDDVDQLLMTYVCEKSGVSLIDLNPTDKLKLRSDCEQAKCNLSNNDHAWITNDIETTRDKFEELTVPLAVRLSKVLVDIMEDAEQAKVTVDEVVLVGLSTQMPWVRRIVKKETGIEELCVSVKADRAVSQGAAIQAAILSGADSYRLSKVLMIDALPYTIGVESGSGKFIPVLNRNAKIPCVELRTFTTHSDFQRGITLDIFEGEEPVARDNRWVGCQNFPVTGGSKFRAGELSLDVTFEVTMDGTLVIDATTRAPGKEPGQGKKNRNNKADATIASEPHQHNLAESEEDEELGPDTLMLGAVLSLLVALFIALKIYFPPPVSTS